MRQGGDREFANAAMNTVSSLCSVQLRSGVTAVILGVGISCERRASLFI